MCLQMKVVQDAKVEPIVMMLFMSVGVFVSSWLVTPFYGIGKNSTTSVHFSGSVPSASPSAGSLSLHTMLLLLTLCALNMNVPPAWACCQVRCSLSLSPVPILRSPMWACPLDKVQQCAAASP